MRIFGTIRFLFTLRDNGQGKLLPVSAKVATSLRGGHVRRTHLLHFVLARSCVFYFPAKSPSCISVIRGMQLSGRVWRTGKFNVNSCLLIMVFYISAESPCFSLTVFFTVVVLGLQNDWNRSNHDHDGEAVGERGF